MKLKLKKNRLKYKPMLLVITCLLMISTNTQANISDPYTIYGTVKDENGVGIVPSVLTVMNINTNEINNDGNDTITGSPVPVNIEQNGVYTFELANLKSGYRVGDEILIFAEKDGITSTRTVTVKEGSWGDRADITFSALESPENAQWLNSLGGLRNFFFIFVLIAIMTAFVMLVIKRKNNNKKPISKKNEPLGWEITQKEFDRGKGQFIKDEKSVLYQCPECTELIQAEDANCPGCGVQFTEI